MDQLNAANQHKATVFNQKMAFDLEKESLNTSKCLIIVDFKENLRIGRGPVEFKKVFYNYNQLSVLGFSVISKDLKVIKSSNTMILYQKFFPMILYLLVTVFLNSSISLKWRNFQMFLFGLMVDLILDHLSYFILFFLNCLRKSKED